MGLILDSSVVVAAERRGHTVGQLLERVLTVPGDQDAALSSVGLTELIHGIYRAETPERRMLRQSFIEDLLLDLTIYLYTKETAMLAGKIDGEQQAQSVTIPFAGLLIGATALSLSFVPRRSPTPAMLTRFADPLYYGEGWPSRKRVSFQRSSSAVLF